MSRSVSSVLRAAVYGQQTPEVFLVLLAIDHGSISPIYVANNNEDVASNGVTYTAFPFSIVLPGETLDAATIAELVIDNVDRSIVEAIRSITTAATVTISVVLASDPDTVEVGPISMRLKNVRYDARRVSGSLTGPDWMAEPFPQHTFRPSHFPGVFGDF